MNIGEETEELLVEPIESPVPDALPLHAPEPSNDQSSGQH
jgi:hypothetical protein